MSDVTQILLVEKARQKLGPRRGGGRVHLTLDENIDEDINEAARGSDEIVAVSEALSALAEESPIKVEAVKLRYFAGLDRAGRGCCAASGGW